MHPPGTIDEQKAALRARLKELRAGLSATERAEFSLFIAQRLFDLAEVGEARSFFVYISHGSEVETHPIIDRLLTEGKQVAVPKISAKQMAAHRFTAWEGLVRGQLGILTPAHSEEYHGIVEITVTPGLGFSLEGHRLGFGAGYYDQWFATHPTRLKIGLAYELQILERLPVDEQDRAVDVILTERRTIRTR